MSKTNKEKLAFVGLIGESLPNRQLSVNAGYLTVIDGKVFQRGDTKEFEQLREQGFFDSYSITYLNSAQVIIPGFVDCHTHAPQFPNIGIGLDKPLLEWLKEYTFPLEKQYADLEFAGKVYNQVVQRLIKNGTTTACYFGTLYLDSTIELAKGAARFGQRALVGKVSMNIENNEKYFNNTNTEIQEVETFIQTINGFENDLIQPIITPRFAVSCDTDLMLELGRLAEKYDCRIQTHISENKDEIAYVLENFPSCVSYAEVYDKCKLLTNKSVLAHGVHLSSSEMSLLAARGAALAHCPASNTRLGSGLCPVRRGLEMGINTGLGTDVAGGDSSSILDAMRRAMDVSTHLDMLAPSDDIKHTITWIEAFYLATLGGAKVLNLDDKIGNFDIGKDFDALLIDVHNSGSQIDYYDWTKTRSQDYGVTLLQQFVYLGDDRNIIQVYVKGNKIKNI